MTEALNVRDLLNAYLRHSQAIGLHVPSSRKERVRCFDWFCRAHGAQDANSLRPYHLTDFVESQPGWRSVSTKRANANYLKAAFRWAAEDGRIDRNPFATVRYAEAERRPDMPDDLFDFIARQANKPFERAIRFARLTWCRLSELSRCTWDQIDLDAAVWTIPADKSRKHRGRPKIVALVPEAVSLLREVASTSAVRGNAQPMQSAMTGVGESVVFLNTQGRPWNKDVLGNQLRLMKARFGLTHPATLHGLRHRGASAAIAKGAPIKIVAEQLGHSSVVTVERFYHHPSAEQVSAMRAAASLGRR